MFDIVNLKIASIAINQLLCSMKQRWDLLDRLYSERFYLEQELARLLHKQGKLDDEGLQRAWADIDRRAADYDNRCLGRWVLADYLRDLSRRLRSAAQKDREGVCRAA